MRKSSPKKGATAEGKGAWNLAGFSNINIWGGVFEAGPSPGKNCKLFTWKSPET